MIIRTYTHTHALTDGRTDAHIHAHTRTHSHIHTHARTHTPTHTHTQSIIHNSNVLIVSFIPLLTFYKKNHDKMRKLNQLYFLRCVTPYNLSKRLVSVCNHSVKDHLSRRLRLRIPFVWFLSNFSTTYHTSKTPDLAFCCLHTI